MKKARIWPSILLVGLIMVWVTSCKDAGIDFTWDILAGSGSYNASSNTSTIQLNSLVKYNQADISSDYLYAYLEDWKYILRSGGNVVLEITKDNYQQILSGVFVNISGQEEQWVYVLIESRVPMPGDIFHGMNPDSVELRLTIVDSDNHSYDIYSTASFTFTRN